MPDKPLIKLENVYKIYETGSTEVRALDGITLEIFKGEFVAIMGASGSGKSTLMNAMGCLDRPTKGSYRLDGEDVSGMTDNELARIRNKRIGFVFQSFNLLRRTSALENVELPLIYGGIKNRRARARESLEKVGLGERIWHKPSQLSGGESQRVAVARALVTDPDIIMADEPTGNLDSKVSAEIMELFWQFNVDGKTIIVVTHEKDISEYAGRIIRMIDGKIVSDEKQTPRLAKKTTAISS